MKLDKILLEFRSTNIQIFDIKIKRIKDNVGLGNALNIGLKACDHEWIMRMDSDDVLV